MRTIEDLTDEEVLREIMAQCRYDRSFPSEVRHAMRALQAKLDMENGTGTVTREMWVNRADAARIRSGNHQTITVCLLARADSTRERILITLPAETEVGKAGGMVGLGASDRAGDLSPTLSAKERAGSNAVPNPITHEPEPAFSGRRPSEPPKVTQENCPCRKHPADCCRLMEINDHDCVCCLTKHGTLVACLKCGRQPEPPRPTLREAVRALIGDDTTTKPMKFWAPEYRALVEAFERGDA